MGCGVGCGLGPDVGAGVGCGVGKLDGVGVGMVHARADSALTSEGDISAVLPQIQAAGGLTLELWLTAGPQQSEQEQLILAIGSLTDREWRNEAQSAAPCERESAALIVSQIKGGIRLSLERLPHLDLQLLHGRGEQHVHLVQPWVQP